ncbi:neuraminidase-like domain-containing protein [Polyangium spumosum]|nr:neuraminidase-like domain-containing protein [Polyangium spumosum]
MNEEFEIENATVTIYRLQGRIFDLATGYGVGDVYVEAWDQDGLCPDLVGTAKTDERGDFIITLDEAYLDTLFADRRPALKFRLFESGLITPPPTVTWQLAPGLQRIHIGIDVNSARTTASPASLVVRGTLTDEQGSPLTEKTITVYNVVHSDLITLATTTTDGLGRYRITYRYDAPSLAGRTHANVIVEAPDVDAQSARLCRAPATAIVHLVRKNATLRGRSEFHRVSEHVVSVVGQAALSSLTSDDISLVACTTGEDRALIELLVTAALVEDDIDLNFNPDADVAIIYALLRQNLPQTRRGLLSQRLETLRRAVEQSMATNIIPTLATLDIDALMELFEAKMVDLVLEAREDGGKSFDEVLATAGLALASQQEFVRAVILHEGPAGDFWGNLSQDTALSGETIDRLKRTMQLGALTRYHAPLVARLHAMYDDQTLTSPRDLARYDEAGWKGVLVPEDGPPISPPPDTPGANEIQRMDNYAKILERTVETAFPTAVIADRVTDEVPGAGINVFFENNPEFEFGAVRVSRYLAQSDRMTGVSSVAAVTEQLKKLERIFRITPLCHEIKQLLDAGLHSAQSIYRMGKRRFVAKFGPTMRTERAEAIFGRACWITSAATALFAKFGSKFNGLQLFSLPNLTASAASPHADIADWASLFGSPDGCACEHCRSVYGPAAYLVDLLEYLDRQDSNLSYSSPEVGKFSARDALIGDLSVPSGLKGRRPDIAHLLLSCKNTNTTLPYIDLVNEILEVVVANQVEEPDLLWPANITSEGTAQELLAEPEIIHPNARLAAYAELADAIHPFELPFHLWGEEARVYLEHLGVQRHELLETFLAPADEIARERLRMSKREWEIVTAQSSPTPPTTAACWGMTGSEWITHDEHGIKHVSVFLQKAGISFEELRELFATKYVNPITPSTVKLNPEAGCDIDAKLLDGLDEEVLGRIHRFLRLRKRLGFSITELDWTVSAFGATDIDAELVRHVADLVALRKELDLPLPVLLSFWGDIGTYSTEWGTSLYEATFLTKSALAQSAAFADVPSGPVASPVIEHAAGICVALRINMLEFGLLAIPEVAEQQMGITSPLAVGELLSLANLSRLHRIVALARGLRIGIQDLLVLLSLSGLEALTIDPLQPAVPATTRAVVELARKVQRSKLTIAELHYLVRHAAPPGTQAGLSEERLSKLASEIETIAEDIVADTAVVVDSVGDITRARLEELLEGATATERATRAEAIVAVIEGRSALDKEQQRGLVDAELLAFFGADNIANAMDNLVGPMIVPTPPPEESPVGPPAIPEVEQRFAYLLAFLQNHVRRTQTKIQVEHKLTFEMKLEPETLEHLLTQTLNSFASSGARALFDFMPGMHAALGYAPPTPADPEQQHPAKAIRRLHKAALVVTRLGLDASELDWLYPTDELPIWLDLNRLHLVEGNDEAADRQARFRDLMRLVDLVSFLDTLPQGHVDLHPLFEAASDASAPEDLDSFCQMLAERLGWAPDQVKHLAATAFGFKVYPVAESDFLDEKAILCLHRALQVLAQLGASAEQAVLWASVDAPLPPDAQNAADIVLDIKRVARAKHDDAGWSEVARPLRDMLRTKQRDALVRYLVAKRNLSGPNELFDQLLIDVEMSPCQLTSRIKQAISSVQTFVQRALLGLEESVPELGEEAAREWDWMKSYRIWEANRKVFLYPENWIEPELRDDKTPFFETLESRLLQGEVTAESAESAYREYLGSLHEVSRLEVAAICHEREDDDEPVDIVHVIARTYSMPRKYYYRRWIDSSYWTPWEKVDLDIPGDHLLATVWNRRLHLFWPMFEPYATEDNKKRQRVNLAWSQYQSIGFGPVAMTKGSAIVIGDSGDLSWMSLASEHENGKLRIDCLTSMYAVFLKLNEDPIPWAPHQFPLLPPVAYYRKFGHFLLDPCVGAMEAAPSVQPDFNGWGPQHAIPARMQLMEVVDDKKPGTDDFFRIPAPKGFLQLAGGTPPITLLQKTPGQFSVLMDRAYENVVLDNKARDVLVYSDSTRTFFMDTRYQTTVTWRDILQAFPNAPAPVGRDAAHELDPIITEWANEPKLDLGVNTTVQGFYRFHTFYHPYVCEFVRQLERHGIDGLLRWDMHGSTPLQLEWVSIHDKYQPTQHVGQPFPIEDVDFSFGGAYSLYNWELFFHAPFLVATRLSRNGRFEEADRWFRYIFDPTGGVPGSGPERFWNVRPFRENLDLASIQAQLEQLAAENPNAKLLAELFGVSSDSSATQDMTAQIDRWRENPFNPHLIARMRPLAYQKSVVMKYVENLLSWGDSLFRRDTMESINEATQLYILASRILGDRPRLVKTQGVPPKSYAELEPNVDAFSNALVELEPLIQVPPDPNLRCARSEPVPVLRTLYFCVPPNDEMLALWDTVEDRLFKIRHCMNIDGTVRQLALFEPPIDPGLLVKAAAAGLDFGELLSEVNAPIPIYRFSVLQPKAVEFASSVISLGASLLTALEKRDGEALSLLRQTQEIEMLESVREVRKRQVDEARESLEAIRRSKAIVEERWTFYRDIKKEIEQEETQRERAEQAKWVNVAAEATQLLASVINLVPQFHIGMTGLIPTFKAEQGGRSVAEAVSAVGRAASAVASYLSAESALAGIAASNERRWAEWKLQERLAQKELEQIDRQILAAEVRLDIAKKEFANHELSAKNAKEVEDYLKTKYTSEELYDWMVSQVESVYFQAYKLAYELAKRAERAFQFELAQPGASYITFGYWDSVKKGLLAGERLQLALRRMEAAYLEQNKREYEITKHISLAEIDPQALLRLRETTKCEIKLPEALFDQDWPGHYLRRIKSVSMTVPVVNGPYASVNCKLTLLKSSVRMKSGGDGYARDDQPGQPDARFLEHYGAVQSIVTSSGQSDAGLFELVFRDERYLPFEGSGAESTWRIELDGKTNRFDPTAVHDVVLHVRYTARDGGELLKTGALDALGALNPSDAGPTGFRLFSAKTDFPDAWHVFLTGEGEPATHTLSLPLALRHFQPLVGSRQLEIKKVHLFAKRSDGTDGSVTVALDAAGDSLTGIELIAGEYGKLLVASIDDVAPEPPPEPEPKTYLDAPIPILVETSTEFAPWTLSVGNATPGELEDLWIVCEYQKQQ